MKLSFYDKNMGAETQHTTGNVSDEQTFGAYPENIDVKLAAKERSQRYYFRNPTGGISSIPAMSASQAKKLLADKVRGFTPKDFEQVDGFDAEPKEYPHPINSDRDINEHDIWMLQNAMRKGNRSGIYSRKARKNPTEKTVESVLDEWDDPTEIPLHDHTNLQDAHGVGAHKAHQIVGAAVANNLIERPNHPHTHS